LGLNSLSKETISEYLKFMPQNMALRRSQ